MTADGLENPSVAWVSARLAEMDAAIASVQQQLSELSPDAQTAAENSIEAMRKARDMVEDTVRGVLEKNQATLSNMREEMQPAWSAFESALETWSGLSKSQHDVFAAQVRAQAEAWSDAFDQLRRAAESTQAAQRKSLLDQIEQASTTVSQSQIAAAALQNSAWDELSKALKETRDQAEQASQQILAAMKLK